MIKTDVIAYSVTDLNARHWCIVAQRDRGEESWQYYWERPDTKIFHKLKDEGLALVIQDQNNDRLIAYAKRVGK